MDRTELTSPVRVTGPSFLGLPTTCTLVPVAQPGIFVKLPGGDAVPLSRMTLGVNRTLRFLTLGWNSSVLRIPEHLLGVIFNLGVDGIVIDAPQRRLPYDGRARQFWAAITPVLRPSGTFDWVTVAAPLEVAAAPGRAIRLTPAAPGARSFAFEINVGYAALGEVTLRGVAGAPGDSETMASSRPYLGGRRVQAIAALARLCGWPHGAFVVQLRSDTDEAKTALLEELCWHRLLDMLGSFMAVCPPGARIAGSVVTRRVGHAADVELVRRIKESAWVAV